MVTTDQKPIEIIAAIKPGDGISSRKLLDYLLTLTAERNIDRLLPAVAKQLSLILGVSPVTIWFLDREGKMLEPVARNQGRLGRPAEFTTYPKIGKVFVENQPRQESFGDSDPTVRLLGSQHVLMIPIRHESQPFGMISLDWHGQSVKQGRIARKLAEAAAAAIANLTEMKQTVTERDTLRHHAEKLEQVHRILERFRHLKEEEEVLKIIPRLACDVLGYNYALIEGMKGKRLQLIEMANRQPYNRQFRRAMGKHPVRDIAPEGLVAKVLNEDQPLAVNNPEADPRIHRLFIKRHFGNLAFVPLTYQNDQFGILLVGHHRGAADLEPADMELLSVFSRMCSYALSSIRDQTYREKAAEISEIAAESVLHFTSKVIKEVPAIVGAKDGVIALPNEDGVLEPVAWTSRRLITPAYRKWLAELPFRTHHFDVPHLHSDRHPQLPQLEGSLTLPIEYEHDQEFLGLVHIFNRISGNFAEEDAALLKLHTSRIGYVLKNVELVESLGQERRHFASIVHGSADGIISIDSHGRIEFFNPAMEKLTGVKESEAAGRTCFETFDLRDESGKPFHFLRLQELAKQAGGQAQTATVKTAGGRGWVGITASGDEGTDMPDRTILVLRDITEEYQLLKRQQEFVSIASHELRTPITALTGYLSLLHNNIQSEPEQLEHFLSRANRAATRLAELVEDLLHVARIEEDRVTFQTKALHPSEIMAEVVAGQQPAIDAKELRFSLKDGLTKKDLIRADRSKLAQIIGNLLENAVKYTPAKGKVSVVARSTKKDVVITIRDSGIGIHPDNLERVFEKFFREYTDLSVSAGGTGLGLFITKELVQRQGGRLEITSQQGKGTTATVRFPRADKS